MEAIRTHNPLMGTLLFCMLAISIVPTQVSASEGVSITKNQSGNSGAAPKILTKTHIIILLGVATTFLLCSENARTLVAKAYLRSEIATLRLLLKCPLTSAMKQAIETKIDNLEAIYTTRSVNNFTSENLKALLKEFKELVDVLKAGKDIAGWVGLIST